MKGNKSFKRLMIFTIATMMCLAALAMLPSASAASTTTISVSQPVQVTTSTDYERGQAIVYDGADYYMFYGKDVGNTGTYGSGNPDTHTYEIWFKKATTVPGLVTATGQKINAPNNNNIYLGEISASEDGGSGYIYVYAARDSDGAPGGTNCAFYRFKTNNGGLTWASADYTAVGATSALPDGSAHHASINFGGDMWIAWHDGSTGWDSRYYDGAWHPAFPGAGYNIASGAGTGNFFVDGSTLYFVRAEGSNIELYNWSGSTWSLEDSVSASGAYDPTIYKVGPDYVCAYAPWVSPVQYITAKVGTDINTLLSLGSDVMITAGSYGGNNWVDMWPTGFTDAGGDTYLFYTSEMNPSDASTEIAGNIFYLKVDWDVKDYHFNYIQNAIDDTETIDGDTITVDDGTYNPFIVQGKNDLTIQAGSNPIITGNQLVYAPVYGVNVNNIIFVNSSVNIDIIGFDIIGTNPGGRDFTVFYVNSSGSIQNCLINSNNVGNMNALAVRAVISSDLTVDSCNLMNYGRIGIYARDDTILNVYDSTLIGTTYDLNDGDFVNYGIEIESVNNLCIGDIDGNDIYDHNFDETYGPPSWSSAGIIIDGWRYYGPTYNCKNSTVMIEDNNIYDNYFGVEIVANANIHMNCNNIFNNQYEGAVSSPYYDGSQYLNYTLDAECNWWGDCDAPLTAPNNVTDYVDYDPWIGKIEGVDAGGPYSVESWDTVQFEGTYTSTPGCCGETVTFLWNFGDGQTSTQQNPTHIYDAEDGPFTATFTVITTTTIRSQPVICSESDTVMVTIDDDDPPIVQLEYPRGGEELSGTVNIQWFALDSEDQGSPWISLYYTNDGGDSWVRFASGLQNTIGPPHYDRGEYSWNTGSLPDGNYIIRIYAKDSAGNRAKDTKGPVMINNRNTGLQLSYVTTSSNYVRDNGQFEIYAGVTQGLHLTTAEITADLTGLGYGASVPADTYDGMTATWTLTDITCTPSDGPITITITIDDTTKSKIITADNTQPILNILKPENALYFFNAKLFTASKPIIIGGITIETTTSDLNGIEKTEIYIDDILKETLTTQTQYYMNQKLTGRHNLKIITYDLAGNTNEYNQDITFFNLFGDK